MSTYLTFGIEANDLEEARISVEQALGVCMVLHDSLYLGGEYYLSREGEADHIRLVVNYNFFDEEYHEPEHSEYPLILYLRTDLGPCGCNSLASKLAPVGVLLSKKVL